MSVILGRERDIRMIKKLDKEDFDIIYAILEDSFPEDERRSREGQLALLDDPRYCVYGYGDGVKGIMAIWDIGEFAFLEHFAVKRECRNLGLGSQMLSDISAHLGRRICLEVEPPIDTLTKRRVGFYQRNGMSLNHYGYIQPSLGTGRNPVPLMIMTSGGEVDKEKFDSLCGFIYTHAYKLSENEQEKLKNAMCQN
jgi:ribosomal protein S18 acetylase RimI-like enzyme